jgi:hypothetical protein
MRSTLAVGRLHSKDWEGSLALRNDGTEPLEIKSIVTTCPCFTADVDCRRLLPGESTTLRAKGHETSLGGFTYAIRIGTNEPDRPEVKLPVRGYLEHPVAFSQPVVWLRGVVAGEEARAEVDVDVPTGVDPARLWVKVPEKTPLGAELKRGESHVSLLLHWRGAPQPGWHRYQIEVYSETGEAAVGAPLPCAVEVVPEMDAFPRSLTVEPGSGETWRRKLTLEARRAFRAEDLSVRWADPRLTDIVRVSLTKSGPGRWVAELEGSAAAIRATGVRQTALSVWIDKREVATVPVFLGGESE